MCQYISRILTLHTDVIFSPSESQIIEYNSSYTYKYILFRSCFLVKLKRSSMSLNRHNLSKYKNRFSDKLQNASPVLTFRYSAPKHLVRNYIARGRPRCISDMCYVFDLYPFRCSISTYFNLF